MKTARGRVEHGSPLDTTQLHLYSALSMRQKSRRQVPANSHEVQAIRAEMKMALKSKDRDLRCLERELAKTQRQLKDVEHHAHNEFVEELIKAPSWLPFMREWLRRADKLTLVAVTEECVLLGGLESPHKSAENGLLTSQAGMLDLGYTSLPQDDSFRSVVYT